MEHCLACGSAHRLTTDHIVPLTRGGIDEPANRQRLCNACNASKQNQTMDEWLRNGGPERRVSVWMARDKQSGLPPRRRRSL